MMNNIIFLDVDGVLNSERWNASHKKEIDNGMTIDEETFPLLKELVVFSDAKIVLHSGWKYWFDENINPIRKESAFLVSLLEKYGMKIEAFTPNLVTEEMKKARIFSPVKGDEILLWLSNNPHEKWVVLDDIPLKNPEVQQRQIVTDAKVGLSKDDICKALSMMK